MNPYIQADISFNPSSRPRGKLKQVGSSYYTGTGYARPSNSQIFEYLKVAREDSSVSSCLFLLIDSLLSLLGPIQHPDPDIQDFLRTNIAYLGGGFFDYDGNRTDLYWSLYNAIETAICVGWSDTEVLYRKESDYVLISDFVTYHPTSIVLRVDKSGRLTDGNPSFDPGYLSGIWQQHSKLVYGKPTRIPLWKTVHLVNRPRFNNPYGDSSLDAVYRWTLIKEAILEMYILALDAFGSPKMAITLPLYPTNETTIDPRTGEERTLNSVEVFQRNYQQMDSDGGNTIILPQVDEQLKPDISILTTANNPGSVFKDAIALCDQEISKGLLVPYGMLFNNDTRDGAAERQVENFNRVIRSVYKLFIQPFLIQSFHWVVKFNFSRDSAKIPPSFPLLHGIRPEDRLALTQVVRMATDTGYLNPLDPQDWTAVRQMIDAPDRDFTEKDRKYVEKILLDPRNSQTSEDKSTGARKGKGNPGRPLGTNTPQDEPRS